MNSGGKGVLSLIVGFGLSLLRSWVGADSPVYVAYMALAAPWKNFVVVLAGPVGFVVKWIPSDWLLFSFSTLVLSAVILVMISCAKGWGWIAAAILGIIIVVYVFGPTFMPSTLPSWIPIGNSTGGI